MIKSWSASRVFQFEECAAKLRYSAIDKLPEPEDPDGPLARGKRIHAEGEHYLKAKRAPQMPASYRYLADELRALRKGKAISEEQWGFNSKWEPVSWWDATIRMVIDAHRASKASVLVVDFKSGKPRQKDEDQVGLYAVGAFARYPKIKHVVGQLLYTDLGSIIQLEFNEAEMIRERNTWEQRAHRMMNDTKLEPRPGYYCKWCWHRKSNGGPCPEDK